MNSESVASTWSSASPEELLSEIFGPLVGVLVASGLEPATIQNALLTSLEFDQTEKEQQPPVRLGAMQRECMEVMCRWRRDRAFLDEDGRPRTLPIIGRTVSFESLCKASNVASDPKLLLATLREFGAIDIGPDGSIRSLTPTFLLGGGVGRPALDGLLKQIAAFLRVICHNIQRKPNVLPRFERMCTVAIAAELLPIFERTVQSRGQEFIDGLDEWLERHRRVRSTSGDLIEVGVGAYFVDLGKVEPPELTSDS